MLYTLSYLSSVHTIFNIFHYTSFRAVGALLTSLLVFLALGNYFINWFRIQLASGAREYLPEQHKKKAATPTMGGLLIGAIVIFSCLLWCNLETPNVWLSIACMVIFGALGFIDDWSKIVKKKGIFARTKSLLQFGAAITLVGLWLYILQPSTQIVFPFFKHLHPDLGLLLFAAWAVFIMVGASNAVNLTDGLDGLATGSLILNFATFGIIAFLAGNMEIAEYLSIPFANSSELAVVCAALVGACIGFLWYNTYPAEIFMGDVGSLSLGALLAFIALMVKQEVLLAVSGGLFVIETFSVIAQVSYYRLRGKRLFKMAPLHHHYELHGWPEAKITIRFGIITFIFCLLALMTLKIR